MELILPPSVPQSVFDRALKDFAAVVGRDWVLSTDEDRTTYLDVYALGDGSDHIASAAVAPQSVEEIQAVLRIANEYKPSEGALRYRYLPTIDAGGGGRWDPSPPNAFQAIRGGLEVSVQEQGPSRYHYFPRSMSPGSLDGTQILIPGQLLFSANGGTIAGPSANGSGGPS